MARSGNAHGILCALRSFPCPRVPRISAVHPRMPLSKSFAREPDDFYGLPVAFIQNSFRGMSSKVGPTTRTIRPASGSCCRGQAEPMPVRQSNARPANPAMGFLWSSLGRVGCFFTARVFLRRLVIEPVLNAANRRSLAFRWLPSAHGFCGDCCRRCTRALGFL